MATNGDPEEAAESDIATAAADDAPEEAAAAEDAGDAPETAEEPTTEVAEAEAPSDEDEAPEDGSEPDGPPRTIAESAGREGEDEVVRGDVPSSEGGDADEAAPAEEAAEKPKPRRRRRTTKKAEEAPAEAATSEAAVAESAGSAAPAVESAVAPGEEGAEPVSAESEAPEAAEAASEEASTGTSTEAATETATEDTSEGSSEAAGEATSEAATGSGDAAPEATAAGETSSEESPSKPRRSRRGGKRSKKSEAKATEDAPADAETASEAETDGEEPKSRRSDGDDDGEATEGGDIDTVGAEDLQEEDLAARAIRRRRYKIQDVVKSRQIMLVQVVKEERGTKGAALTTYLSLAGRYCVLMPNTARGGGISRKITNASDRKRLREIVGELEVPQGMGLIVRTAGAERTRAEIKRDYEFLLRQWEQIRELTLRSTAPCLIYEEGSLIKRSIRDIYSKEIDAVLVEGEGGYREAKDYMKMLMPSHAKNVQQYQDQIPLFIRYQVESYLNGMFSPVVQLKSGGYLVIGVTEALVAIDVNSGRSTKEGSIEETATKTNLEAADEVARQLRLRDLAGLIVIDFIDMDESRNNRAVEKRMKDRLKNDRARIQVGRISGFGLMEMSRQRLRPGMLEATTKPCPHCHGQGFIRSDESLALGILREIEEEGVKGRASELMATMPVDIANYIVNSKRRHLAQIEERYGIGVQLMGDPSMVSPEYRIERAKGADRKPERGETTAISSERSADLIDDAEIVEDAPAGDGGRSRDNGRRRGDRRDDSRGDSRGDSRSEARGDARGEARDGRSEGRGDGRTEARTDDGRDDGEGGGKKRRRGKRGGRRRRGNGEERERREDAPGEAAEDAMTEAPSEPGDGSAETDVSEVFVSEAEFFTAYEEP
ncbi:MAG: Rne/Rng family ribonuclease, partial [Pseudomonadota bacterium]